MKKIPLYSFISIMLMMLGSCSEHELSYNNTVVDANSAQLRVMYDLAETSSSALSLAAFKFNGVFVSSNSTSLGSGFPSTASPLTTVPSGVYQTLPAGPVKMEFFRANEVQVYDQTVSLPVGKQTAFIYSLSQPPMMVADEPFLAPPDPWLDTCAYVSFVNLLYQTDKVTPFGKLTLQLRRDISSVKGTVTYEDVTIATVDYKAASGWIKVKLRRNRDTNRVLVGNWSGVETGLILRVFNESGTLIFQNATVTTASSTASLTKGRYYYIHMNGNGTTASTSDNKRLGIWTVK